MRMRDRGDVLRRALGDDLATVFATLRAKIDGPVGVAHHIDVVLDDDDSVAKIGQPMQHLEQPPNVVEMESGRGLVEQVEGAPGLALRQLAGELHTLGFASRKCRRRLAEMNVAEADIDEGLQLLPDVRNVRQDRQCVFDGQVEHVGDRVAVELYRERFLVVTLAVTHLAGNVDIRHEVHLDASLAVALTGFAASAGDVEGEAAGLVAAFAGLGQHGVEVADGGEDAGIGRRVRARRAADGRLVDADGFIDLIKAPDSVVLAGLFSRAIELPERASDRGCR